MWLQDYWQGFDQGEALTAMILRNETSQDKFWDFMHEMFIKRNMNRWPPYIITESNCFLFKNQVLLNCETLKSPCLLW